MAVTEGLRERKKRATLEAIRNQAVRLFLRDGYDNVTVDMICDAAGISQRTFFNYVGSKENALLGSTPPLPDERRRAAYIAGLGGTPFEDLVRTLTAVSVDVGEKRAELIRLQFAVIRQNPDLARLEAAHMEEARGMLADLVRARLAADAVRDDTGDATAAGAVARTSGGGATATGAPAVQPGVAEMTVSLALTVFRHLRGQWAGAQGRPVDAAAVADSAIGLLRRVVRASR